MPTRRGADTSADPGLPGLDGKVVVVTGGSTGLGYFVTERLAALGASVVVAARDADRAERAVRSVRSHVRDAEVRHLPLDLSRLESVKRAADELAGLPRLDGVVANAALVALPDWSKPRGERGHRALSTADGLELHWGTNHLGHYAFVARLVPALLASGGRIVHVGSVIHSRPRQPASSLPRPGEPLSDLAKYARSKLAVMSFAFELARRLERAGATASSVVAHPGTAVDVLSPPRDVAVNQPDVRPATRALVRTFAHGKHRGAESIVTAAAAPHVRNGDYWGPSGWKQLRGLPARHTPHAKALDAQAGRGLVALSEQLTGVRLPV